MRVAVASWNSVATLIQRGVCVVNRSFRSLFRRSDLMVTGASRGPSGARTNPSYVSSPVECFSLVSAKSANRSHLAAISSNKTLSTDSLTD
jgi:hypothetical protein